MKKLNLKHANTGIYMSSDTDTGIGPSLISMYIAIVLLIYVAH